MKTGESGFGVIFDVDGTMVNNTAYHRQAWIKLAGRYGMSLTDSDYHRKIHARSNDKIVQSLFGADVSPAVIEKIAWEKESLYRGSFAPELREIPGLSRLLSELKAEGVLCAAASNSPKENVDFVLDGLGIRSFFCVILNRDQVSVGKPDPEVLLKAAEGLRFEPRRCLVFEDSASGFKAARAAGMRYAAITAATDPVDLAETYDAIAVLPDFTSLSVQMLSKLMIG